MKNDPDHGRVKRCFTPVSIIKSIKNPEGNRNITFDVLRGIAILCVVFTHLPGVSLRFNFVFWWCYAFVINMAVPVFMILMGYCAVMSAEKHNLSPWELYSPKNIVRKFRRYFFPWFPVILLEILSVILGTNDYTAESLFYLFITGGYGPGSYYIPILFQFVLVFPVLFFCRKNILLCSFLINFLFEVAVHYFQISGEFYRLCILRYMFLLGLGMKMYYAQETVYSKRFQLLITGCGIFYLLYMTFFLDFGRSYPYWWGTFSLVGLYLYFPVRYVINSRIVEKLRPKIIVNILACTGICSYHIFLVQMFYYSSAFYIFNYLKINSNIRYLLIALCAFPICIVAGCLYYHLENVLVNTTGKKASV